MDQSTCSLTKLVDLGGFFFGHDLWLQRERGGSGQLTLLFVLPGLQGALKCLKPQQANYKIPCKHPIRNNSCAYACKTCRSGIDTFHCRTQVIQLLITLLTSCLGWSFPCHMLALAQHFLKASFSQNCRPIPRARPAKPTNSPLVAAFSLSSCITSTLQYCCDISELEIKYVQGSWWVKQLKSELGPVPLTPLMIFLLEYAHIYI